MEKNIVRATIYVDKDSWNHFKANAIREGKSASEIANELIDQYNAATEGDK